MDENVKGFMLFSDQKEYVDMLDAERAKLIAMRDLRRQRAFQQEAVQ